MSSLLFINLYLHIQDSLEMKINKEKSKNQLKGGSRQRINAIHKNDLKNQKTKKNQSMQNSKNRINSLKNDKNNKECCKQKLKNTHLQKKEKQKSLKKAKEDSHHINMKNDLKMLISKNILTKNKLTIAQPDILKKIEQNCRILKKIDERGYEDSHKKSNRQQSKDSKQFQQRGENNKSGIIKNKIMTKSRLTSLKNGIKNNRHSYQISKFHKNNQGKQNQDIASQNLFDTFQQYKKLIEAEQLKIQKGSKNTNYHTSQSRNSSSLLNSHALPTFLQSLIKNSKVEQTCQLLNIQNLIKNQKKCMQASKEHKQSIQLPLKSSAYFSSESKASRYIKGKIVDFKYIQPNDLYVLPSMNPKPQQIQNIEEYSKKNDNSINSKRNFQKYFQKSKFYVPQIPVFQAKKTLKIEDQDSLIGCEIPLIENNIIDDSQLPDLQL